MTVDNDSSKCSVGGNTVLNVTEDASATEFSNIPILDSESFADTGITWSHFIISVDIDGSIAHERIYSQGSTLKVWLMFHRLRFQ